MDLMRKKREEDYIDLSTKEGKEYFDLLSE